MGKRIAGAKVIVIDEISLTNQEDFYKQTVILKKTEIANSIWWTPYYFSR